MSQRILIGDCREVLPTLEAGSVQMCVTSPPYWGLRDYGTAAWEGGDEGCDHRANGERRQLPHGDGRENDCYADERVLIAGVGAMFKHTCRKCGARRIDRQLGLESTPAEYVANMVEVFALVREVLADDGTCWINLADSYAQKELIGIPWRVAFALQADGWYLRQDIIWNKPNPMPESVTDRCTKSHEYLFLLAKSERYYFDAAAIAEPYAETSLSRFEYVIGSPAGKDWGMSPEVAGGGASLNNGRTHDPRPQGRNKRSVWTVTTQPYAEAHFATFPPALIEPCILAGSRPGDTVLDPFAGSGTTGQVAEALGRRWTLIELNPAYEKLGLDRTRQTGMVFV